VVDEQHESEKRKLNLIFHNVCESTKQDGPSRKANDVAFITTLLCDRVGTAATVTNAFHLGKKSGRPRLLKISISSTDEKSILRQCHKLKKPVITLLIYRRYLLHTPFEQKKDITETSRTE